MLRFVLLILVPLIVLVMFLFNSKDSFFDLRHVLKSHILLFRKCKQLYFFYYFCPAWLSIGISLYYKPSALFYENMLVVMSIILSVLFSMSGIIVSKKDFNDNYDNDIREKINNVIKETHNSIMFSVGLSISIILCTIIGICFGCNDIISRIIGGVIYYLFQVSILTILLIIKRIGKLIDN